MTDRTSTVEVLKSALDEFGVCRLEMQCAECARLGAQRELLEARYAKTLAILSASVIGGMVADFLENRRAAYEAKIDLDRAEADLLRHHDRHA